MPLCLQLHSIPQRVEVGYLTRSTLQRELLPRFHLLEEHEACNPEVRLLLQFRHELKSSTLIAKVKAKESYWIMMITSDAP